MSGTLKGTIINEHAHIPYEYTRLVISVHCRMLSSLGVTILEARKQVMAPEQYWKYQNLSKQSDVG